MLDHPTLKLYNIECNSPKCRYSPIEDTGIIMKPTKRINTIHISTIGEDIIMTDS